MRRFCVLSYLILKTIVAMSFSSVVRLKAETTVSERGFPLTGGILYLMRSMHTHVSKVLFFEDAIILKLQVREFAVLRGESGQKRLNIRRLVLTWDWVGNITNTFFHVLASDKCHKLLRSILSLITLKELF